MKKVLLFVALCLASCKPDAPQPSSLMGASEQSAEAEVGTASAVRLPESMEIPKTSRAVSSKELVRIGYAVSYNPDWRIPNWVAYELTRNEANGHGKREGGFESDPEAGRGAAENSDYKNSGYSRGHMAPAGDMKWNNRAMRETFLLTNICPQDFDLNAGVWEDLESALRDRARRLGSVYIVCGPVVKKGYRTIGHGRVCVPQSFFKAVCWKERGEWHCKAFVFPNKKCAGRFHDYSTTVDDVERLTGHDLFYRLPDSDEQRIEASDTRGRW